MDKIKINPIYSFILEIRIRCEHLLDEAIRIGSFARKEMEDAMNDTNIEIEIMMRRMMEGDKKKKSMQMNIER